MGYTVSNLSTTALKAGMGVFKPMCQGLTTGHLFAATTEVALFKKTIDFTSWDKLHIAFTIQEVGAGTITYKILLDAAVLDTAAGQVGGTDITHIEDVSALGVKTLQITVENTQAQEHWINDLHIFEVEA